MNIDKPNLARLLAAYFDRPEITEFAVMAEGKENTSAKVVLAGGGSYILRIYGEAHGYMGARKTSDIDSELDFMIHCYEQGIPVPKVYLSKAGNRHEQTPAGQSYVVMDYVPGELPAHATPDMIKQVAGAMARMHLLGETYRYPAPRSWPGTVLEVALERLQKLTDIPEAAAYMNFIRPLQAALEEALKTAELGTLPRGPIHGDIFWENVKFEGDTLKGIFDFDDCRDSYFLEDITKSLTIDLDDTEHGFFGVHGENVRTFLDAYDAIRPLTEQEKALLALFLTASFASRLARYLSKTVDGKLVYLDRVSAYIAQYEQNRSFFLRTA